MRVGKINNTLRKNVKIKVDRYKIRRVGDTLLPKAWQYHQLTCTFQQLQRLLI